MVSSRLWDLHQVQSSGFGARGLAMHGPGRQREEECVDGEPQRTRERGLHTQVHSPKCIRGTEWLNKVVVPDHNCCSLHSVQEEGEKKNF